MHRTSELEKLFECWQGSNPEFTGRFYRDGIVDESKYDATNMRILFVLKEPANPPEDMRVHAKGRRGAITLKGETPLRDLEEPRPVEPRSALRFPSI